MRKEITTALRAIVVITVVFGLAYPLATTAVSQLAFPNGADGSRMERDGKVIGSRVIGQDFSKPVVGPDGKPKLDEDGEPVLEPDLRYFQARPSVTGYDPSATFFNNLGPNNAELSKLFADNLKAYLEREGPANPGLDRSSVPPDAVQTTASGVDPHISLENARLQARRVAVERGLPPPHVLDLVDQHVDGRGLGVLGEPGVNVLALNLALDEEAR